MRTRVSMRWLAWPVIAGLVVFLAMSASLGRSAEAAPADTIGVAAPATVALGSSFDVNIDFLAADTGYAGYQAYLSWDVTKLSYNSATYTDLGGMTLQAAPVPQPDGVLIGAARPAGTSNDLGTAARINLTCIATGTVALHLKDLIEDPAFGTTMLGIGGVTIPTTLVDDTVDCLELSDLEVTKTHTPEPMIAGSVATYTVTVHNIGPNNARGVVIADIVPPDKVVQGLVENPPGSGQYYLTPPDGGLDVDMDTAPDAPCAWYSVFPNPFAPPDPRPLLYNIVLCYAAGLNAPLPQLAPSQSVKVVIPVIPDLLSAGKTNVNEAHAVLMGPPYVDEPNPTIDPNPANSMYIYDVANIAPATIVVTKTAPAQKLTGDSGQYTINVSSTGPSPASNVVVTDTMPAGVTAVSASWDATPCAIAANTVTCDIGNMAVSASVVITINVTFDTAGTKTNTCTATWADPVTSYCPPVDTLVLPPFNGFVKDARPDQPGMQDLVNLWLCRTGPDCHVTAPGTGAQIGKGILDVAEWIFLREDTDSPNDSDTLPEGLAAYEEQVKFDHKVFDITVADAGADGLDNDADTIIDEADESVIRGPRGNINCSMTILTENWIMFGCVSAGQALGNPMPVGLWLKTIRVTPDADMFLRIRPTKDNGVVRTILDENCEVADIYASEPWPFTLPGGLTPDCTDLTVTVRMLEGDLNLDCLVNVLDQQAIAFRYGSSFGLLLYDPFYDLEPKLTDFDIDIKDLQFVFGRDGSQCQAPIPNQPPEPPAP